MQWVEKETGKWTHPSYGAIEQIEGGIWRIVNPAGEIVDTLDGDTNSLEASQRYQEFIWAGWNPCGERMWEHRRYGTICKTNEGEWFGRMSAPASISDRNDPYRVGACWKGPYERSGWAKKELWRLWPLAHAAKIVSRAEDAALCLFASLAAIGIIDPVVIAVLSLGVFLVALLTDNRTAWASTQRELRQKINHALAVVSAIPLCWLLARFLAVPLLHFTDRSFVFAPLVGAGVLYLVMRVIGMVMHALCIAAGPVPVVPPEKRMPAERRYPRHP